MKFANYNCYRNDRKNMDGGGGVMLLVSRKFDSTERRINSSMISKVKTLELLGVELDGLTLIVAYARPQNIIDFKEFEGIMSIGDKILFGGDINARHRAWDEPTRYGFNKVNGSTIDIFLTNNINTSKPVVLNELTSDHLSVAMSIYTKRFKKNDNKLKYKLNLNKTN
ncbi:hypothetical protein PV325_011125 [Microctonus aethiopoides]|nr:hypothetical protein PV325_011125 [Microctonus aethiopoides]